LLRGRPGVPEPPDAIALLVPSAAQAVAGATRQNHRAATRGDPVAARRKITLLASA